MTLTRTGENKGCCTNQTLSVRKKIDRLGWKFFSCKKDEDRGQLGVEAPEILQAKPNLVAESMMRFVTKMNSAASTRRPSTEVSRSLAPIKNDRRLTSILIRPVVAPLSFPS